MKTVYWLAALLAAGLWMGAVNASATSVSQNGVVVASDTYELETAGTTAVAEVGTWIPYTVTGSPGSTRPTGIVTNAASPGPFTGSQYLSMSSSGFVGSLGTGVNLATGDTLKYQTMINEPFASRVQNYPWEFVLFTGNGAGANSMIDFYVYGGTDWASIGPGGSGEVHFAGPTNFTANAWHNFTFNYTVGAANASLSIDGTSVPVPVGASTPVASTYFFGLITNRDTAPLYLDNVAVPEPSTCVLLALGGVALTVQMRRRNV